MDTFHFYANRRISKPSAQKQTGQSLIEYVIYIGLAALVLAGIIYFATSGRQNTAVNTESKSLTAITTGTQKLYNGDPTAYKNVTVPVLINNGVIPPANVSGVTMVSGFGTPITVKPATLYVANDGVAFTYSAPQAVCSAFVMAVAQDFAKISVGGTTVQDTTAGTAMAAATLGTACAAGAGASVTLVFTATR